MRETEITPKYRLWDGEVVGKQIPALPARTRCHKDIGDSPAPKGSKKPHTRAPGPKNCADLPQNMSQPQINPLGDRAGDAPGDLGFPPSGARPRFCSWGSPNLGWRRAAAAFLGPIAARTYLALHQAPPKKRGGGPKTSSPPGGSRPRLLEAGRSRPGSAPTAASSCERRKRRKQAVLTKKKWGFGEGGGSEGGAAPFGVRLVAHGICYGTVSAPGSRR